MVLVGQSQRGLVVNNVKNQRTIEPNNQEKKYYTRMQALTLGTIGRKTKKKNQRNPEKEREIETNCCEDVAAEGKKDYRGRERESDP